MTIPTIREKLYENLILESSHTPLKEILSSIIPNNNRIVLKLEYANPVGSIHLRVYPYVFKQAEQLGYLKPGLTPVIEASLGNAAAAFAYCANKLGYDTPSRPKVVVPENISRLRFELLKKLGAEIIYSPMDRYNIGYVEVLEKKIKLAKEEWKNNLKIDPRRLYPVTKTRKNAKLAYFNLVDEVFVECKKRIFEPVNYFVGVVGSGTSISGIGERLKQLNPNAKIIAAEALEFPNTTSLLKNGIPLPLSDVPNKFPPLTAIGVPINKLNLEAEIIDRIIPYKLKDINDITEKVLNEHGIEIGKSTAGCILSAIKLSEELENQSILVCAYDELKKWD